MQSSFWHGFEKRAALRPNVVLQPQQERVQRKLDRSGGLLAYHGLGSGKTLTSLAATQGDKVDVVVPAALRNNYLKETALHTTGHKPNVMSYEKAMKTEPAGNALVIDEAHNLGHSEAKRTQVLTDKARHYDKRLLLTATPIRNYPHELAPLLRIVRGDKAAPLDRKAFDEQYVEEHQVDPGFFAKVFKGAKPGVTYRMKNRKKFEELVNGYVDYHAPSSENFPSVSHEIIETPMNKEQLQYYNTVMGKAGPALRWKIKSGMPPSRQEAKDLNAFLSGVRQISNTTRTFGGTEASPKIQRAVNELMARHDKDKDLRSVIYSNFLDSGLNTYSQELAKRGVPHAVFSGGLSDKQRKQAVDDYNAGKIKALLISGAGAQGIDLKGTKLMQLLEPHWQENRLEQATGRAVRYKSHAHLPEDQRHVHVQRYLSTIPQSAISKFLGQKADMSSDQYLEAMSKRKEELNRQFLDVLKAVGQRDEPMAKAAFFRGFKAASADPVSSWLTEQKDESAALKKPLRVRVDPRELSEWQGPESYFRSYP